MPILDVEIVLRPGEAPAEGLPGALARAAGAALEARAGGTWVRLRTLPRERYGEDGELPPEVAPAFVTVLLADPPTGAALRERAARLAAALAPLLDRPVEHVHVLVEPAARGRIAFGGRLRE